MQVPEKDKTPIPQSAHHETADCYSGVVAYSGMNRIMTGRRQESADGYLAVVARLSDRWRVIVCKDDIQWILQRRDTGTAERPWRGKRYFVTNKALLRDCGDLCGEIDPRAWEVLGQLPASFGGAP